MESKIENFKERDRSLILEYLKAHGESLVDTIIAEAGAERLRVYPLLFELEQAGTIVVVKSTDLGAPTAVRLK